MLRAFRAAARAFRRALDAAGQPGAPSWQRPLALYYLGDLYYNFPSAGDAKEAEGMLRASAALWKAMAGEKSLALAVVYVRLGRVQQDQGRVSAGQESLARAEQIVRSALPADHPVVETWPTSADMLHPEELFRGAIAELQDRRSRSMAATPMAADTARPMAPTT